MESRIEECRSVADAAAVVSTFASIGLAPTVLPRLFEHEGAYARVAFVAREGDRVVAVAGALPGRMILGGRVLPSAQVFIHAVDPASVSAHVMQSLAGSVLGRLESMQAALAYAVPENGERDLFSAIGFDRLFDVHFRNIYLGLHAVSKRLKNANFRPVRSLASIARRVRQKLIEVSLDENSLRQAARLFAMRSGPADFSLVRDEAWLRWRYVQDLSLGYRMLVLRRAAGKGLDALAVIRVLNPRSGRTVIELSDYSTKDSGRRAGARLMGEVALWALEERADLVQALAVAGSSMDHVLVATSGLLKEQERALFVRALDPGRVSFARPFATKHVQLCAGDLVL